jgi:hypothetical protein
VSYQEIIEIRRFKDPNSKNQNPKPSQVGSWMDRRDPVAIVKSIVLTFLKFL